MHKWSDYEWDCDKTPFWTASGVSRLLCILLLWNIWHKSLFNAFLLTQVIKIQAVMKFYYRSIAVSVIRWLTDWTRHRNSHWLKCLGDWSQPITHATQLEHRLVTVSGDACFIIFTYLCQSLNQIGYDPISDWVSSHICIFYGVSPCSIHWLQDVCSWDTWWQSPSCATCGGSSIRLYCLPQHVGTQDTDEVQWSSLVDGFPSYAFDNRYGSL